MAWFWQQKKEEQQKATAQKKNFAKKRDLIKNKAKSDKKSKKVSAKKDATSGPSKPKVQPKPDQTGDAYKILLGPIITEKTARLAEKGTYVFAVARDANKISIAKSVKIVYGVDPIKVTKSKIAGKKKIFSGRRGKRSAQHKAFVSLKSGQAIELFEKV